MPLQSPFHPRIAPLCTSYAWKHWGGYYAVCRFGETHLPEYWAFREACAVTDVTPLFKYELEGRDAARLLSRMMVRSFDRLRVGRVAYTCWCDPGGKVIDVDHRQVALQRYPEAPERPRAAEHGTGGGRVAKGARPGARVPDRGGLGARRCRARRPGSGRAWCGARQGRAGWERR